MVSMNQNMIKAGAASIGLHVVIIVLGLVVLPTPKIEPLEMSEPIQIEFIAENSLEEPAKPPPPKEEKRSPPPKMTEDAPPDLTKIPEPEPEPIEETPPPEDAVPLPDKVAEPVKVPKPPPKVPRKPTPPKPPEPEVDAFSSLLKNLTPDIEENAAPLTNPQDNQELQEPMESLEQRAGRLNFSEEDALRAQLAQCWNVMSGAKMAEDLIVRVLVQINPDRTVYNASLLDQSRYNSNAAYRAAADSALRALRNPACSPLELPPEKYEQWKTLIIRFDPQEML